LSSDTAPSWGSRLSSGYSRLSPAASDPLDDASAFASRPRLSMSPAYSSGSGARTTVAPTPPATALPPGDSSTPVIGSAATPSGGGIRGESVWQSVEPSSLATGSLAAEQGGLHNSAADQQLQQQQQEAEQEQETAANAAAVQQGASIRRDSWSTNPLAGTAGLTPEAAAGVRRLTHSPAPR
jgi:hypothetical protein